MNQDELDREWERTGFSELGISFRHDTDPDVDAEALHEYPYSNLLVETPGIFRTAGAALLWTAKVLGVLAIFAAALYVLIVW